MILPSFMQLANFSPNDENTNLLTQVSIFSTFSAVGLTRDAGYLYNACGHEDQQHTAYKQIFSLVLD